MGDIAEYYYDLAMEQEFAAHAERELLNQRLDEMEKSYMLGSLSWVTAGGEEILLSKMSIEHINNTIKFLERKEKSQIRNMWVKLLKIEVNKR